MDGVWCFKAGGVLGGPLGSRVGFAFWMLGKVAG